MFLRFMRSLLYAFFIASLLLCGVLWPVYGTTNKKELPRRNAPNTKSLSILALANALIGASRLWAAFIFEYVLASMFVYFLYRDYAVSSGYQSAFRSAQNPDNYSVIVHDIPTEHTNETHLRERFELMFPVLLHNLITTRRVRKGLKTATKLDKIVVRREQFELQQAQGGNKEPTTLFGGFWKPKVNAPQYLTEEQARLDDIIRAEYKNAPNATSSNIVFSNMRAASIVAQANQGANAGHWLVQ